MDIDQVLQKNPSLIARKASEAEELRLTWQKTKELYAFQEAKFVLTLKAEQELKATEIKYYVNNDIDLYNLRLKIVLAESNYRRKEVEIKGLEEELNASKMLARIRISEISNLSQSI